MRFVMAIALVFALALGLVGSASADKDEKKKEETFEGKVTCAKCDLGKEKKCATVLVVKQGDKETIYWFDAASHKKHHGDICQGGKAGKVTASVSEKDGKKWVAVSKLEWTEK